MRKYRGRRDRVLQRSARESPGAGRRIAEGPNNNRGAARRCLMVAHRAGTLAVAVVAVAMVFAIGSWEEVYAKPEVHYKCYKIVPSGPPVTQPPPIVDLQDQFGLQEDVLVTASELLCAPALKTFGVATTGDLAAPHLKCYVISRDVAPLRQPATLTDQFGDEDVTIMEPQLLCQEVTKILDDDQ
jgi:hypothetical protein